MRHRASFWIPCAADVADSVAAALGPEAKDAPEDATVACRATGEGLEIAIEAGSLAGLRAACQGTVRLADAALRVAEGRP